MTCQKWLFNKIVDKKCYVNVCVKALLRFSLYVTYSLVNNVSVRRMSAPYYYNNVPVHIYNVLI